MTLHARNLYSCLLSFPLALTACGDDASGDELPDSTSVNEGSTGASEESGETGEDPVESASLTHRFGPVPLEAYQEHTPCVQWTLDNDASLYVQAVTLSNLGYFHHSNWFVVPEDAYPGEDGYYDCSERDFTELGAAGVGTVLFAQSTQSFVEEQRTGAGAVVKIPPRHKVVGNVHFLNSGPNQIETDSFMTLDLIHPRGVDVVLTPFRLSYLDLDIPANSLSTFTGVCDNLDGRYLAATGSELDIKLHYVLPHYHYLGNLFDLRLDGGPYENESVFKLEGFNGEANGGVFDPPLDLTGVEGIRYTCGYDNWRDVNVGWGIGDQEMCVMLGLAESEVLIDISVLSGTVAVGNEDGVQAFEGTCGVLMVPKNNAHTPPTSAEIEGPFEIPPNEGEDLPPVPACVDHDPEVAPTIEPTLANVFAAVFQPSCTFNACHGASTQAAGLNLQAPDLLAELLDHEVSGSPGSSLVEPGDPENSWLYQLVAECEPQTSGGDAVAHMPRNAPVLLGDTTIALVREWIAAGANP